MLCKEDNIRAHYECTAARTFDFVWSKEKNLKLQINQQHTGKIDIQHQQQILMIASGVKYTVVRVLSVSVHGIQVSAHLDISKIFGRYLDIQQRFIKLRMKHTDLQNSEQ